MAGAYETDFRAHPEAYRYDSSEQGVFKVQPYKDELLPDWGFKDEAAAEAAVEALREAYERYRAADDFVGMDMARKYLQMGFTRAIRWASRGPCGTQSIRAGESMKTTAPSGSPSSGPIPRSGRRPSSFGTRGRPSRMIPRTSA